MSLLKSDRDFEPITPTRTALPAAVYGVLGAILAVLAFVLISSTAYRENAGVTLQEAQTRTRAVLPYVLALAASSLALFGAARLVWIAHRHALVVGAALLVLSVAVGWLLPSGLRGYVVTAVVLQVLALGAFVWLRARA